MRFSDLALCLLVMGCGSADLPLRPAPKPVQTSAPVAAATAALKPAPSEPPSVEPTAVAASPAIPVTIELPVQSDRAALLVAGNGATPIIYLHGLCGDPTAFEAWVKSAAGIGPVISLTGDVRCKNSPRSKFSSDIRKLDARITLAVHTAQTALGRPLDSDRRIVVGYSQGALRAEALATRFPERYPKAILIAGPRAPRPESLGKSEAVLLMAGDQDVRKHLIEAADKLHKRGRNVRFMVLPGAKHGEYGDQAERIFEEAFAHLGSNALVAASKP